MFKLPKGKATKLSKPFQNAYSKGGPVQGEDAPRSSYYGKLTGRDGEPEGYDSRDGQIGGGYEPPGSPAPQRKK